MGGGATYPGEGRGHGGLEGGVGDTEGRPRGREDSGKGTLAEGGVGSKLGFS